MLLLDILLWGLCIYLFLMFVGSRFFVPFLGWWKTRLPESIPKEMEADIEALRKKYTTQRDFLEAAFEFIKKRFEGKRLNSILRLDRTLESDVAMMYRRKGFIFCTQRNHLLRIFLVRSRLFTDDDIKLRHQFFQMNIHQYMKIRVDGEWIDVDPWAVVIGLPLGKHPGWIRYRTS